MSTNGKTLKFRAAKLKGFTVVFQKLQISQTDTGGDRNSTQCF